MADDKILKLILTNYGKNRIEDAMEDPSLNLALTKIKVGNGDNGEYYEPSEDQTELKGDSIYEFYVYDKQLLEDGLTVSFHTIIPEDVSGFDIREVGLYEVDDSGKDHLFAVATQQPLIKPAVQYNYLISVNYYIFLKADNLADVYDRITLDVEHAQVSEADLESLLRSFLFAQENLMLQVGKNSELIGYNRPTQIMEKVNENKQNYSYITLYKNFASVLDLVDSPDDILYYWAFDYSRRETLGGSIVDLSNNKEYLNTSVTLSSLPHIYRGFQSMFTFAGSNYYYLPADKPLNLYDSENNRDKPFTMAFSVEPISNAYHTTRTLLAKSNRATGAVVLEVQETNEGALQARLYADKNHYITFKSSDNVIPNTAHSIVLTYNPVNLQMIAYINSKEYNLQATQTPEGGYTHINTQAVGNLYGYSCSPIYETYAGYDVVGSSTEHSDYVICIEGTGEPTSGMGDWVVINNSEGSHVVYGDLTKEGTIDPDFEPQEVTLYAYVASDDPTKIVYTEVNPAEPLSEYDDLYNADFTYYEGEDFSIVDVNGTYKVMFGPPSYDKSTEYTESANITRTINKFIYNPGEQVIYTVTNNLTKNNYPLYSVTFNELHQVESYDIYTGDMWTFAEDTSNPGTYNLVYDKNYNGGFVSSVSSTPIEVAGSPLTSYIIDANGNIIDNVNSSVGIISIMQKELTPAEARILALNLCATLGINPFLTGE